jgi:hypothetical protein
MIKYAIKHKNYGYCSVIANWETEVYELGFDLTNIFVTNHIELCQAALDTFCKSVWYDKDDFDIIELRIEEVYITNSLDEGKYA